MVTQWLLSATSLNLCEPVKLLETTPWLETQTCQTYLISNIVPQKSHQTQSFTQVQFNSLQISTNLFKALKHTMPKCAHKGCFKFVNALSSDFALFLVTAFWLVYLKQWSPSNFIFATDSFNIKQFYHGQVDKCNKMKKILPVFKQGIFLNIRLNLGLPKKWNFAKSQNTFRTVLLILTF